MPTAACPLQLRRGKSKAAGEGGAKKKEGPTVIAPVRDQVYGGGPQTPAQRAENSVVALLATLFFVILAEGIFVAGSVRRQLARGVWRAGATCGARGSWQPRRCRSRQAWRTRRRPGCSPSIPSAVL